MTTTVRAAAVYARISSDQEGAGLGVARQVEDCQRLAGRLGWPVAEVYQDNDFSAYSGKRRPAYERMLADLRGGARDAVIVYHVDRLTRRPIELEHFVATLDVARVRAVRFVVGDSDIMTGDGLMVVRMLAAVAANESASKSRRVKRKMDQNAEQGKPHGGFRRPFGYDDDKVTVRPDEAATVRTLAARFLAGESLRSLAEWLNTEEIATVGGGQWRTTTLRAMLRSGRIAGLRDHRGQVLGRAAWGPIITEAQRAAIIRRMDTQAVSGRRTPRRYLLSGMLRCGKCGHALYSAARQTTRRYVCTAGPDHGGCGRLTVVAEPVEQLITGAVLIRLSSPDLAHALAGRASADEQSVALVEQLDADRGQLAELTDLYSGREISKTEWLQARSSVQGRVQDAERRLSQATNTATLDGLIGEPGALTAQWADLNLDRQVAVVRTLLDHAVIGPGTPGARTLDVGRVGPIWRL